MMLVDFTEMDSSTASAVSKLMAVYAEHFQNEGMHIAQNERSGATYLALDGGSICPFSYGGSDVLFEVVDFETGDTFTCNTLEEAQEEEARILEAQLEDVED